LYAASLILELQHTGYTVLAICKRGSKIESFLREQGIETLQLPSDVVGSLQSVRFLRSLVRQRNVDVLHVHFHRDVWNASLALRGDRARKLFLSIYMGVSKKKDPLHRIIYARVDGIFTSSRALNERLPELYPVPVSKIHLLPYGRMLDLYAWNEKRRKEIRASLGVRPDELLVGTMVRIDPGKGVMDFARSFPYLESELQAKVKYLIVGEPTRKGHHRPNESPFEAHCETYLRAIEAYIRERDLREKMVLAGFQSNLIGYLSAMDVFVFPSRDEMYSLVVLDAMGMGLPVVAARAGGNLQQIEDETSGLLYDVADSADLARQLSRYLCSEELRKKHGAAARSFVEQHHDMKRTVARLLDFYTST
jgi:glycosyltransferase involved in cell wall biosynthesis